ncbi:hypothetical protein [Daejeonella sp.]|uniref:hypothetical protein n=1 Tax=Daejeonella sp. TaxID=2805397 RepID=UPI002D1B7AD0|nr:hypothetical protein [Daejeonella sp.]HQT58860.1 hypothetical protein [Daejeonella sp.]
MEKVALHFSLDTPLLGCNDYQQLRPMGEIFVSKEEDSKKNSIAEVVSILGLTSLAAIVLILLN